MDFLIWLNTLVIMVAVVVGLVLGLYENRKIVEALARIGETAARNERLSMAILNRVAQQSGQSV